MLKKKCLQKSKKLLKLLPNIVLCGALLFILGCKKQRPHSELGQQRVDPVPLDIPTPVSTEVFEQKTLQESSYIYEFKHPYDASFYKTFYESAMVEVGWHQESCVQGATAVTFIFKKPRKWCTLLLEPHRARFFISKRNKKNF